MYDECRENVRGEYSLVKYTIRNQKTLKIVYVFKKPSEITLDKNYYKKECAWGDQSWMRNSFPVLDAALTEASKNNHWC